MKRNTRKTYRGVFRNFSFLGGNRQLSMVNIFITAVLGFLCGDIGLAISAVAVGGICQLCLRRMFSSDPLFHRVLIRRLRYRSFYLAQAPYFAVKTHKRS